MGSLTQEQQERFAKEYLETVVEFAHKLGMRRRYSDLEELESAAVAALGVELATCTVYDGDDQKFKRRILHRVEDAVMAEINSWRRAHPSKAPSIGEG